MVTLDDIKKKELVAKIDDIAFFIGSQVTKKDVDIMVCSYDALFRARNILNGEYENREDVAENLTMLAYYLGTEINECNADYIAQAICTLYEAKKAVAA